MGIGGLGRFGILFVKAMGATVIGISHDDKKKETAKELGCDDFIRTSNKSDMAMQIQEEAHTHSLHW